MTLPDEPGRATGALRALNRSRRSVANAVTGGVLSSPAHRVLSGALVELGYVGPRSGRRIALVTQYAEDGDGLVVYVGGAAKKTWWRVFRGDGWPIRVRVRGTVRAGHGRVLESQDYGYDEAVTAYRRRWPQIGDDASQPVVVITFPAGGPTEHTRDNPTRSHGQGRRHSG